MGWALCYNIRMSTTHNNTAETSRPCCCVCGADHVDDNVRDTPGGLLCVMCMEDVRGDMCADAQDEGYDDPYWEQYAED